MLVSADALLQLLLYGCDSVDFALLFLIRPVAFPCSPFRLGCVDASGRADSIVIGCRQRRPELRA